MGWTWPVWSVQPVRSLVIAPRTASSTVRCVCPLSREGPYASQATAASVGLATQADKSRGAIALARSFRLAAPLRASARHHGPAVRRGDDDSALWVGAEFEHSLSCARPRLCFLRGCCRRVRQRTGWRRTGAVGSLLRSSAPGSAAPVLGSRPPDSIPREARRPRCSATSAYVADPSPSLLQHATAFPSPKPPRGPYRLAWATLLGRVFAIDVLHCERCGGRRQLVTLIQTPQVAEKILAHLGLSTRAPAAAPARATPPDSEQLGPFAQDDIDPIPPSWHD